MPKLVNGSNGQTDEIVGGLWTGAYLHFSRYAT